MSEVYHYKQSYYSLRPDQNPQEAQKIEIDSSMCAYTRIPDPKTGEFMDHIYMALLPNGSQIPFDLVREGLENLEPKSTACNDGDNFSISEYLVPGTGSVKVIHIIRPEQIPYRGFTMPEKANSNR